MTTMLFKGDCLQLMPTLPDKSVDCFICDLPYGCLNGACDWDTTIDLEQFWAQVKRLARNDHVPVLMFCTTRFGYQLIKSNESWYRYDIVWEKTNGVGFLSANKQPLRRHEMIYVFSKKGAAYNRVEETGNFPGGGGGRSSGSVYNTDAIPNLQTTVPGQRCSTSVVCIANKKKKGAHPTAKPIELYKWLLERYCPAGGTVLDPTFGSCNSGRAAKALGLKYRGFEMEEKYYAPALADLCPVTPTI